MHRTLIRLALLALFAAGGRAAPLPAQGSSSLSGRVVDTGSGGAIQGATVRVEGDVGPHSVVTGPDGRWRVDALSAGRVRITVRRIGYAERVIEAALPAASGENLIISLTASPLPLDALVVTASRRLQRLADAPVTTELITRRDIEIARVPDLSTLLTQRLGIQLEGGHPAGEGVMLQGLGSERVLILLDGQPLVGRLSGTLDISRLPTSMVERVEVVKGSQSSLYGSEAMGGVVNVITRSASTERWALGIDLTTGSQGRVDASTNVAGTLGEVDYLVDAGRRTSEVTPGIPAEQGALAERWDGLVKLGWTAAPELRIEASGLLLDERQRWQGGQLFQFADNVQRGARVGAEWSSGPHRLSPTLHWTEFEHLSRQATVSTPAEGTGESETQRLYEAELLYNLGSGASGLDLGLEAKREEIGSDRVSGQDRSLHTLEPFAQATLAAGLWRIVPGARLTWSEEWGAHFTPRLATLVRPIPTLALRASVGRGYRAPSFKELYLECLNIGPGFAYTVRGNPVLQPETSTNLTLGAEWSPGTMYIRAQGFETRFDEFIETTLSGDSSGVTVYSYGNVSDGFTRGLELEGGVAHRSVRFEGGYSFLVAESGDGGKLLGRPGRSGRASIDAGLPRGLRGALTGVYTGATPVQRTEAGEVLEREGFLRFDANLSAHLPAGMHLTAGARNIFDARPGEWPGFTGRHLFIGVGWRSAGGDRSDSFLTRD